ncbi:MAG: hypothetical protein F6K19_36160 [Cyanothece sp. SIO1E1]|nr:hypothetical protein [Cyanothece sp. SIO1E1]
MKQLVPLILSSLLLSSIPALAQSNINSELDVQPSDSATPSLEIESSGSNSLPGSNLEVLPSSNLATESSDQKALLLPLNDTEQVRLNLVHCQFPLDCALARMLLPASAFVETWELQFDNSASTPLTLINTAIIARGEQTGYQITQNSAYITSLEEAESDSEISADPQESNLGLQEEVDEKFGEKSISAEPIVLPANQIVSLLLKLNQSSIPPDQYAGSIYLTLEGQNNRMTLPLILRVRTGPLIPLIVLIVGIILGKTSKFMEEQGNPIANSLKRVNQLKADIIDENRLEADEKQVLIVMANKARKLAVREDFEKFEKQIEFVRNRFDILVKGEVLGEAGIASSNAIKEAKHLKKDILDNNRLQTDEKQALANMIEPLHKLALQESSEVLNHQIESVRERFESLIKLKDLEGDLVDSIEDEDEIAKKAQSSINDAKRLVLQQKDLEAQKIFYEIQQKLPKFYVEMSGNSKSQRSQEIEEMTSQLVKSGDRMIQSPQILPKLGKTKRYKRFLIVLSGIPDDIRAEATLWVAKPVLYLALLVALSAVGLNSLYIQNGKTFGANPFTDYFGLILWGLSADIASRSLSNLGGLDSGRKASKNSADPS